MSTEAQSEIEKRAERMLADRGRFPSCGQVPYDLARSLLVAALTPSQPVSLVERWAADRPDFQVIRAPSQPAEEVREKVARAAWQAHVKRNKTWDQESLFQKERWRASADAALAIASPESVRAATIEECAKVAEEGWQSIETAPRDGTILELVVDYTDGGGPLHDATIAPTIGWNTLGDTGEDEWKFCGWDWCHDHICAGSGKVVAWRPSRLNACDDALGPLPAATSEGGA